MFRAPALHQGRREKNVANSPEYRPGLEGVPAVETRISYLDLEHEEIVVRGSSLIELASRRTYVDVVGLLVDGILPDQAARSVLETTLASSRHVPPAVLQILSLLPRTAHPMDALRTALSALGTFDPEPENTGSDAMRRRAIRLVAQMPVIVANIHSILTERGEVYPSDRPFTEDFLSMVTGRPASNRDAHAFDQLLVAYAEHEMPNSTFAARVIASTLADMTGSLVGAVASLKGVLHGGANEAVMRMLDEGKTPDGLVRLMRRKLDRRERIMGFGHRVYMHRPDPRAVLMKASLAQLDGTAQLQALCQAGEDVMREDKGLYPNLDYYAAPVFRALGVPTDLFTPIFFAARTAGLVAHVIEQQENNRLFRPRVQYVGRPVLHA